MIQLRNSCTSQAGARVHGGLYPARNAREDAPKNDRYPNNYGQFLLMF